MNRIILEGIRCFHGRYALPIKPITLLVGENSSGKSTFLALTRLAWDIFQRPPNIDFNEEPFLLGSFEQIASYRGGRGGRGKSFLVGAEAELSSELKKKLGTGTPNTVGPTFMSWQGTGSATATARRRVCPVRISDRKPAVPALPGSSAGR